MMMFVLAPLMVLLILLGIIIGWGGLFLIGYVIYKWWVGEFDDIREYFP